MSHALFRSIVAGSLLAMTCVASAATVATKGVPECNGQCTWDVMVDGVWVGGGEYQAAADGTLSLDMPFNADLGGGAFVGINSMNGNIDPILGFNVSAGTGALGKTFAFSFSLPVALSGTIAADSSVSYSLTALSAAGARIAPLFGGKVVTAQEVDSSVGGLDPLDKGVNVGDTFQFVGGPLTQNSPVYTAINSFVGDLAYDLMSVTVAFSLSAQSQVGLSGFVQQLPVIVPEEIPEPSTYLMVLAGAGLLFAMARRRQG